MDAFQSRQSEADIARNLRLDEVPAPGKVTITREPLSKTFKGCNVDREPLRDILLESTSVSDNYEVKLPYSNKLKEVQTPRKPPACFDTSVEVIANSIGRGTKRARPSINEQLRQPQEQEQTANKTPIPDKTIFFSPLQNKPLQSTPISIRKEATLNHKRSIKKTRISEDYDDSDHLACHAENILRMAVDSTMLGLTVNSFSLYDELVLGKKNFEIFDDEASVIEGMKKRSTLARGRATKIEISADDLAQALTPN